MIILVIGVFITLLVVTFIEDVFFAYRSREYPFKLRLIWWLMHFGIRRTELSEEAHRIYDAFMLEANQ